MLATIDKLIATYHKLTENEQRLLQVLSVIYEPVGQNKLCGVLDRLELKTAMGGPMSRLVCKDLQKRLVKYKLLQNERGLFKCNTTVAAFLSEQALVNGEFSRYCEAAEIIVPQTIGNRYSFYATGSRYGSSLNALRGLRNDLYQGNHPQLLSYLEIKKPYNTVDDYLSEALQLLCIDRLHSQWFDQLAGFIKFQVLAPHLLEGALNLASQEAELALLEKFFKRGDFQAKANIADGNIPVALVLAQQYLLRLRLADAKAILDKPEIHAAKPAQATALLGWYHFLKGENAEAIVYFETSIKALRKQSRKRHLVMPGLARIFYLLTLITSGEEEHFNAAKLQISAVKQINQDVDFSSETYLLGDCLNYITDATELDALYWLKSPQAASSPIQELLRGLIYFWAGETATAKKITNLPIFYHQARQAGLLWYVRESEQLLTALNIPQKENSTDNITTLPTLTTALKVKEPWERALLALKGIPAKNKANNETPEGSSLRLVWFIEEQYQEYLLQPREQKLKKNGSWSKGRAVALSRLFESPESFNYITAEDKEICRCIIAEAGYGYYAKTSYLLDNDQALVAAAGHPRLFWQEHPETPVEVIKDEPQLFVEQVEESLLIQLLPFPEDYALMGTQNDSAHTQHTNMQYTSVQQEGFYRLRVSQFNAQHLKIAKIIGQAGLNVPHGAKEQVLESISAIAPLLTVHSDIGGGTTNAAEQVGADTRIHFHLQPLEGGLKIQWFVQPFPDGGPLFKPGIGGASVFAEIDNKRQQTKRDLVLEKDQAENILRQSPTLMDFEDPQGQTGEWVLLEPESALGALQELQAIKERESSLVVAWPKGKKIKLSKEIGIGQMQVGIRKERNWFELQGDIQVADDIVMPLQQLLALASESTGRFLQLEEGQYISLTKQLRKRLDDLNRYSDNNQYHPLMSNMLDELTTDMQVTADAGWHEQLDKLRETEQLKPQLPSTLQAELRDYQIEGFNWLVRLAHWGAGACLADDMGLGKTIQALALILTRTRNGPTLVLAPTSVCANWIEEVQKFAPTLIAQQFGPGDRQAMVRQAGPFDLIICSYGLLQHEAQTLASVNWHTIVADEAQAIKNPQTKRAKAALALQGDFKMVTTGTPIENHLGELWTLFRFINPGLLGSLGEFNNRFAQAIENNHDTEVGQSLKGLLSPFILRRLKTEVLTELPARTEITIHVELSSEESAFYEALRRQALERLTQADSTPGQHRIKVLAEIMRLRRACCHPKLVLKNTAMNSSKLQAFSEIVSELLDNKHKALVFSQFVGHLEIIREHLDQQGIHYQYLDGSTPVAKRKKAVTAFQAGEGDLFLISLKAGGVGLNLTAADYVIHMDPWWNPAVEDQASDRVHRIGQKRPVTIYRLVTQNTIEDQIIDLHKHKRELAESLLAGTDSGSRLSTNEILALISGVHQESSTPV